MKSFALIPLLGAVGLALAGCGDRSDDDDAAANAAATAGAAAPEAIDLNQANGAGSYWDPLPGTGASNGAGNAAGPDAAAGAQAVDPGSIVTENGVRYRVGPNDARVRVDAQGQDIQVDAPDPDVPPDLDRR